MFSRQVLNFPKLFSEHEPGSFLILEPFRGGQLKMDQIYLFPREDKEGEPYTGLCRILCEVEHTSSSGSSATSPSSAAALTSSSSGKTLKKHVSVNLRFFAQPGGCSASAGKKDGDEESNSDNHSVSTTAIFYPALEPVGDKDKDKDKEGKESGKEDDTDGDGDGEKQWLSCSFVLPTSIGGQALPSEIGLEFQIV